MTEPVIFPPRTAAILDVLAALVGFDTTSSKTNLPLLDYVEDHLARHGVASTRVHSSPDKANLWATIGPADVPGVVLSGHVDVVPVDGQVWTRPPFRLTIEGSRAYGRGTTDMKGFVATCLAMVPAMLSARLTRPIHLCFSHDEETGCWGVVSMLKEVAKAPVKPVACLVGEPTSHQVVIAHKGKRTIRVTARGRAGHSSLAPRAVNALEYAARLAVFVSDLGRRLEREGVRDALYDLPHTTAHVGVFHSGTVVNIVPDEASFLYEFRNLPEDDIEALVAEVEAHARTVLEPEMKRIDPEAGFAFQSASYIPPLDTAADAPVVSLAKRLAGRNDHAKVAYGTEAGQFASVAGIPAVVVGPGSISEAHIPDEWIEIAELDRTAAMIDRLIEACTSGML